MNDYDWDELYSSDKVSEAIRIRNKYKEKVKMSYRIRTVVVLICYSFISVFFLAMKESDNVFYRNCSLYLMIAFCFFSCVFLCCDVVFNLTSNWYLSKTRKAEEKFVLENPELAKILHEHEEEKHEQQM